jgi:uncharacterized protein YyaL (SSP411 family)
VSTLPHTNRLIGEKSPYLLQHAYNPVDWFPWGEEAFEKARAENKPILVSIGYSTCHWCHVMERESYEDPAVAALMNHYLVNMKVDREERPEIDKIYMTAVSAMTGQGGWPLNMFLTPDLKPIFGGTYFPPEARWGQPAWKDVVTRIGQAWQDASSRDKMLNQAVYLTDALKKYVEGTPEAVEGDASCLDQGFLALKASYDASRGGFSGAPKFPMPVYHQFLLRYYARTKNQEALDMSLHSLREMAKGGIYDHLGGGFARYSTDERWHVPHFEKMLYDNAQLAVNYLEAWQIARTDDLKQVAEETLRYVQREMTHPDGGFYSAQDADSLASPEAKEKKEGAFYVWEKNEILDVLGPDEGERFCAAYGVKAEGNAESDPHGEFVGKNILYRTQSDVSFQEGRRKLLAVREKRPRPHLDDKIIAAWNGLMISAFAKAGQILGDKTCLDSARRAARFLKTKQYDPETKTLFRCRRDVAGIADDYAFVVQGLINLYEADFDPEWLAWALELTDVLNERFYDAQNGGYFMTAAGEDKHLILRIKENTDNVEPSAGSVAALNLLRLAQHTDRSDLEALAKKTLRCFGSTLQTTPRALPVMLTALDFALTEPRQVVIAGKPGAEDVQAMLRTLHRHYIPVKTLILAASDAPYKPLEGKAAAYICIRHACQQPTNDPAILNDLLKTL